MTAAMTMMWYLLWYIFFGGFLIMVDGASRSYHINYLTLLNVFNTDKHSKYYNRKEEWMEEKKKKQKNCSHSLSHIIDLLSGVVFDRWPATNDSFSANEQYQQYTYIYINFYQERLEFLFFFWFECAVGRFDLVETKTLRRFFSICFYSLKESKFSLNEQFVSHIFNGCKRRILKLFFSRH